MKNTMPGQLDIPTKTVTTVHNDKYDMASRKMHDSFKSAHKTPTARPKQDQSRAKADGE